MRGLVAAVLAALALLVAGCGSDPRVPSAADQVPALAAALERVDAALASRRFAEARQQLRAMKAAVVKAREAGDLREADAQRVLDAIARLMATIPAGPSRTPESSAPPPTSTSSAPPSEPAAEERPGPTDSPVSTPPVSSGTASPSITPSTIPPAPPAPSGTPTSSPTDQPTTGAGKPPPTSVATPTS